MAHLGIEVARHGRRGTVNAVERAQQRGLVVERLAGIGNENRGDTKCVAHDECRGGYVPGGISAGLECVSYAAVGEARGVRLLLDEELAVEFLYDAAFAVVLDESVMFLGGCFGQRLEPVGVVACAHVDGPLFHSLGNRFGHFARQSLLVVDCVDEGLEGVGRQVFKHSLAVEHVFAVIFLRAFSGNADGVGLPVESFIDHFES